MPKPIFAENFIKNTKANNGWKPEELLWTLWKGHSLRSAHTRLIDVLKYSQEDNIGIFKI